MLVTNKRYLVGDPRAEPLLPDKRTNYRFLSPDERISTLQKKSAQYRDLCFRNLQLRRKHIAVTARARTLVEKVEESSVRGDVGQLLRDIRACDRDGKWGERKALFDFVRDIVHLVALTNKDGQRSTNMRWHEQTLRVFASLKLMGGPKVNRFFAATLEAPSSETIARTLRQVKLHMPVGPSEEHFKTIGDLYSNLMDNQGLERGTVPFELSEDETTCLVLVTYNSRLDSTCEFCGDAGPNHTCTDSCCVLIGERRGAFQRIT
jgi:hypothetical protein